MAVNCPLVTIWCPTYNQEKYISKCLDGFLIQKTAFPIEIIVHDDASRDKTTNILKEYERKYPLRIKCIFQSENQFSKHNGHLINTLVTEANGKYIAICEGDDYWTDPYKLQKQVDFLESNENFSFCFHNSIVLDQKGTEGNSKIQITNISKSEFYTEDLIAPWFLPTGSIVFVKNSLSVPEWFKNIQSADIALILLLSLSGPGKYLDETMSVYRLHPDGLSNKHVGYDKFLSMCYLYQTFNIHTKYKYNTKIVEQIRYEFERHALGFDIQSMADKKFRETLSQTSKLSSLINMKQLTAMFLYKIKLGWLITSLKRRKKSSAFRQYFI